VDSAFGTALADYLARLKLPLPEASYAQQLCERHDFDSARGHLITSVPGTHSGVFLRSLWLHATTLPQQT
jgi:hypothetical protein